jgi:hypothetical protein
MWFLNTRVIERGVMEVSAYDDKNGIENRICHWLRIDKWSFLNATMLIANIDPDSVRINENHNFQYLTTLDGINYPCVDEDGQPIVLGEGNLGKPLFKGDEELIKFTQKCKDLADIFASSTSDEFRSPIFWISQANTKLISIPWLSFAISRNFVTFDTDINGNRYLRFIDGQELIKTSQDKVKTLFDENSDTYPMELDIAIKAWQAVSIIENNAKPKARIKKWLDANANNLSDEAKDRICVVANWNKRGGATRTGLK